MTSFTDLRLKSDFGHVLMTSFTDLRLKSDFGLEWNMLAGHLNSHSSFPHSYLPPPIHPSPPHTHTYPSPPSPTRLSDLAFLGGHSSRLLRSLSLGWIPAISYVNVDHHHGEIFNQYKLPGHPFFLMKLILYVNVVAECQREFHHFPIQVIQRAYPPNTSWHPSIFDQSNKSLQRN